MARKLFIMTHGIAEFPKSESGEGEGAFPVLTRKGKRNAQRVGAWIAENGLVPDRVISSTDRRAVITAEKAVKVAGIDADRILHDSSLAGGVAEDLIEVVRGVPGEARCALVVGHQPGCEDFLEKVCRGYVPRTKRGVILPPGGVAHLFLDRGWDSLEAESADCLEIVDPKDLPRGFPFPGPGGSEVRPRPAYYYRQSGVIPWRDAGAGIEVLLITSSSGRR